MQRASELQREECVLFPREAELSQTIEAIMATIREIRPVRLVIDSMRPRTKSSGFSFGLLRACRMSNSRPLSGRDCGT